MPKICELRFQKKRNVIFIVVLQTQIHTEFVDKVCKMEGAEAGYAFATGMAAIFSTFAALLDSGDHIVSARSIFGSTHTMFTKYLPKWQY